MRALIGFVVGTVRSIPLSRIRRLALLAPFIAGVVLIVGGIALVYPPAGLIAAGLATLALMFFDPDRASRLTWPR